MVKAVEERGISDGEGREKTGKDMFLEYKKARVVGVVVVIQRAGGVFFFF